VEIEVKPYNRWKVFDQVLTSPGLSGESQKEGLVKQICWERGTIIRRGRACRVQR